jgi:hypothetical protein
MNRSGKIRTIRSTWKKIEMIKHVPFDACGAMNHSFGAKNRNQITLPSCHQACVLHMKFKLKRRKS